MKTLGSPTATIDKTPPAAGPAHPVRRLFGVPVDALTMEQTLDRIDEAIARREQLLLGVVNAAKIVNMRKDAELRWSVLTSDLILADGMAVVWAGKLLGQKLPERVAGIDLMMKMLARGEQRGYRVFCFGAEAEILDAVVRKINADFPNVKVVGSQHGYYKPEEEAQVAARIAAAEPDMLFVAMTSPKKERFLARWAETIRVPVCHGVGGSFDVLAGKVRRAPRLWQKLGMEWLYRVLQEPGRLWKRYLVTNTAFCWMTLRERFRPTPLLEKPGKTAAGATA